MELRTTLETPATPTVVAEIPPTVNTIEEANAVFEAAFGDNTNAPGAQATSAVAVVPSLEVGAPMPPVQFSDDVDGVLTGDWTSDDIAIPNLRIVAGSGKLVEMYQAGSTIFSDEVLLNPPDPRKPENNKTFLWAPVTMDKGFREKISQEDRLRGVNARIVSSIAEVVRLGGTARWIGDVKPTWEPTAAVTVVIQRPSWSDHPGFGIDVGEVDKDGKPVLYAVGMYYCTGTAFREVVELVTAQAQQTLRVPVLDADGKPMVDPVTKRPKMKIMLHKNFWSWGTIPKTMGKFTVTVPVVQMKPVQTSDALRVYIADLLASRV